jgi:hypothetical protein
MLFPLKTKNKHLIYLITQSAYKFRNPLSTEKSFLTYSSDRYGVVKFEIMEITK